MCGISGTFNFDGEPADRGQLARMIASLSHRGPDGAHVYCDGWVGLAHARLSIIDLEGGTQPMCTPDGDLWITFNGEIFNYVELRDALIAKGYRFRTRSDTEVILHAYGEYGEDCVHHFNGQWAFAIWDRAAQKLFLSRDRLGVRPLFYARTQNAFLFASEIKALFTVPEVSREISAVALDQIFTFWVTLPPHTAFKDVYQLPPGHSLTVEGNRVTIAPYWRFGYCPVEESSGDEHSLAQELQDLLLDATRIRLRSDVPVGAYLSGGLDSTFIAALIRQIAGERLRTFSVSFVDDEFDESSYQLLASRHLETENAAVHCSTDDIARVFPDVVWHAEQPILRTAPAPLFLLSRLVRESGFKVVLTGEGSDELLGGYDIYKETKIRQFWARRPESQMRPLLLRRLYPYSSGLQRQSHSYLKSFFHLNGSDERASFFSHLPRWSLTEKLKTFISRDFAAQLGSYDSKFELQRALPGSYQDWTTLNRAEYLETAYLLPGYILSSQGDRMAMANSIEARFPFLDHRVVEFAARLPLSLKMKVLDEKHVLKIAAKGLVPDPIRKRAKRPYQAPGGKCFFRSPKVEYAEELLSADRIAQDGIFDPLKVEALTRKFRDGNAPGVKDNMALVGILSTQLLQHLFVHQMRHELTWQQTSPRTFAISS